MSSTRRQLLAEIERFLREHDMRATKFGQKAVRNPAFVGRLREGVEPIASTIDRVRRFMAAQDKKAARRVKREPDAGSHCLA